MAEEINYSAYFGESLPNGNLLVHTSGRTAEGETWDGIAEITPNHLNYALWLSQVNNKEAYHAALNEERRRVRELRRQRTKL